MTNAYKNNVLDYVVNQVTEQTGTNMPLFDAGTTINKSIIDDIKTKLNAYRIVYSNYIYDQDSQLLMYYGSYKLVEDDDLKYGYVYIVDTNLNEVKMITNYASGGYLFPMIDIQKAEDGTYYALAYSQGVARVLLLNNLFAKRPNGDYQVVLRASYIVPNSENYRFFDHTVFYYQPLPLIRKAPDKATYYIIGTQKANSNIDIIEFTINVGTENEWLVKSLNSNLYSYDILIEKDKLYVIGVDYDSNFIEFEIGENVNRLVNLSLGNVDVEIIIAKSLNEIYYAATDYDNYTVDFYKIKDTQSTYLFEIFDTHLNVVFNVEKVNGILVMRKVSNGDGKAYLGILQDDTPYFSSAIDVNNSRWMYVVYNYNLLNLYMDTSSADYSTVSTQRFTIDYNPLNYNGNDYSNYNQTIPKKARLYSGRQMVFARNLYNRTLNGNTATSTLQVPNTLLNDVTLNIENLISETDSLINNKSTSITKNIYETLYINFMNTLNVKDEDTNTMYPNAASYINLNINTGTKQNCNLSHVGKVAINYSDKTIIQEIVWNYDTDHYETTFTIDCTQEVPTIDFISNDETTIYISKELDVSVGSYYVISQKLRIE